MMKSLSMQICCLVAVLLASAFQVDAQIVDSIAGFRYGVEPVLSGKEWESPQDLSLNKEQPHAYFFSFKDVSSAGKVLPKNSPYWLSLNGIWKFNWVKTPDKRPKNFFDPKADVTAWDNVGVPMSWNIAGIQKDGTLKYGVPIYVNQPVIFQHLVKVDDWHEGVMRTPTKHWTTYIYRNEVGSYRRSFEVPISWYGRDIYINFDTTEEHKDKPFGANEFKFTTNQVWTVYQDG